VETDTQTDTHTDTQTKYSNPRCACAPRVNDSAVPELMAIIFVSMQILSASTLQTVKASS